MLSCGVSDAAPAVHKNLPKSSKKKRAALRAAAEEAEQALLASSAVQEDAHIAGMLKEAELMDAFPDLARKQSAHVIPQQVSASLMDELIVVSWMLCCSYRVLLSELFWPSWLS